MIVVILQASISSICYFSFTLHSFKLGILDCCLEKRSNRRCHFVTVICAMFCIGGTSTKKKQQKTPYFSQLTAALANLPLHLAVTNIILIFKMYLLPSKQPWIFVHFTTKPTCRDFSIAQERWFITVSQQLTCWWLHFGQSSAITW